LTAKTVLRLLLSQPLLMMIQLPVPTADVAHDQRKERQAEHAFMLLQPQEDMQKIRHSYRARAAHSEAGTDGSSVRSCLPLKRVGT
jgi:hypothetical protein